MPISKRKNFLVGLLLSPIAAVILMAALLTGCAGAVPWNPQNNAGLTNVQMEWCPAGEEYKLCDVSWVDGKEKADIELSADVNKGTVSYSAKQVRAFAAFQSRADVENFVAEQFARAAPEIRQGLVESLSRALGL